MYGAILGDIIGSPYEWDNIKRKDFKLFSAHPQFSDDTVMTLAVAEGFMAAIDDPDNQMEDIEDINDENRRILEASIIRSMKEIGLRYPDAGYGGSFRNWLRYGTEPYNSWGNGSAMRTSSVAWIFDSLDQVREMARLQAAVTHDHPEGMKGAEALASAIFLARCGCVKKTIREYVANEFGYDLNRTCYDIRPAYKFDVSCQGSVPEAIIAFLDGRDFEDVIRNAVSLGGDSDTIAAMAGSIAEAFYGVPAWMKEKCRRILTPDLREILERFEEDYLPEELPEMTGEAAKKSDWNTTDMPEENACFIYERHFNDREMAALRRGNIPKEMEDKWFWYMEGDTLYAHRSWTGFCIFIVNFRENDEHLVTVNRDPEQYNFSSIEAEAKRVSGLLCWWTQGTYDYYSQWLSETMDALKGAGKI